MKKLNAHQKHLARIAAGAVLLGAAMLLPFPGDPWRLGVFLAAYLTVGGDVVFKAMRNIAHGQVFDENFLMSIATIGAFAIGEYPEGVAVMLFYQVGELFQNYAVDQSRKSITSLMDIRPDYANLQKNGTIEQVDPYDVAIGDTIVVKAGERVPLDGVVLSGSSFLDTSALTGESVPRTVGEGDELLSGCINQTGLLTVRVTKEFGESTVSKILDLVENASSKKSQSEQFITRFARWYTPAFVIAAALLAIVPPLVVPGALFRDWLYRGLTFLVISCPCALVISVPLSFFGGLGAASKNGILIKGSNYLEALARTEIVVFDKTGTLTKGVFAVQRIAPHDIASEELLRDAAYAECFSNHPISLSLRRAYGKPIEEAQVQHAHEVAGNGVTATVSGHAVAAGNARLMRSIGLTPDEPDGETGTLVHVAIDGQYKGYLVIADELKPDAAQAIHALKKANIKKTVLLTGDAKRIGEQVATHLGFDQAYTDLLPADKVEQVELLLDEKSTAGKLAFVGDGINDAPVLARADLGVAMGGLGSDAAIEAADIVIMTDEPSKLVTAIRVSQKTLRIVRQNIVFALGVKFLVLCLGAAGIATMWAAVFADVGVSVLAILNAIRVLHAKQYRSEAA